MKGGEEEEEEQEFIKKNPSGFTCCFEFLKAVFSFV